MFNRLIFILGWSKNNKEMTVVFLLVLSLIVASNLLIFQFFINESTFDEENRHYYTYYLENSVSLSDVKNLMKDLEASTNLCECLVATNPENVSPYNEYFVAAYLKENEQDKVQRNEALSYGQWNNLENEYIVETAELSNDSYFNDFKCAGVGITQVGSKFVDYKITLADYEKLSFKVDTIDVILFSNNRAIVDKIVDELEVAYEVEYQDTFLQSGFDSVRNALILSVFILIISLYSIIAFVEIYLHMQRKDILVLYRCGATIGDLKLVYVMEMILAGVLSYVVGIAFANILCKLMNLSYNVLSYVTYVITFIVFFIVYFVLVYIYIQVTLKHIDSLRLEEE